VLIRRIDIENFRGIQFLSWPIPADQTFVAIIGPGDSTKSTILTAIHHALTDAWNITFCDTDFFDCNIEEPIRIRVAVGGLTDDLMSMDVFGLHLCGITEAGQLTHDPEDDDEPCVVVELTVEKDLEPKWTAYRPGASGEPHAFKASLRAKFGVFRIDDRIDAHLRWSRTSALGRLTEARHGMKQTLADANRAAREAVSASVSEELTTLTREIQAKLQESGSGDFRDLKPGLDTSLNYAQGNLALFEGQVPLMNFGLGSRRLAGAATQQLAYDGKALLLVDEVEHGLEPHRLVHLLAQLRRPQVFAQVFVTTHSPTALLHLEAKELTAASSSGGVTTLKRLDDPTEMQRLLRGWPEAFLARHIVVAEGKTEYGISLHLMETWDRHRAKEQMSPSSALGVVAVEGRGGNDAVNLARLLLDAGFRVTLFADSDVEDVNGKAATVTAAGGTVVQWAGGLNTEQAVCSELDPTGLTALIDLAVKIAENPEVAAIAYADHLKHYGAPRTETVLSVTSWQDVGTDVGRAQQIVAAAAHAKGWFKNVDRGKQLGAFVLSRSELEGGPLRSVLAQLEAAVYASADALSADPAYTEDTVADGGFQP
jgi:hypothetical protein